MVISKKISTAIIGVVLFGVYVNNAINQQDTGYHTMQKPDVTTTKPVPAPALLIGSEKARDQLVNDLADAYRPEGLHFEGNTLVITTPNVDKFKSANLGAMCEFAYDLELAGLTFETRDTNGSAVQTWRCVRSNDWQKVANLHNVQAARLARYKGETVEGIVKTNTPDGFIKSMVKGGNIVKGEYRQVGNVKGFDFEIANLAIDTYALSRFVCKAAKSSGLTSKIGEFDLTLNYKGALVDSYICLK